MNPIELLSGAAGGLALFLYGSKVMSDGIRKASDPVLRNMADPMAENPPPAEAAGFFVAAVLQSSAAVEALFRSFADGLLPESRTLGLWTGAILGAAINGWIVACALIAFPSLPAALSALGIGFAVSRFTRWGRRDLGEALAGFGFMLLGLSVLSPALSASADSGFGNLPFPVFPAAGLAVGVLAPSTEAATAGVLLTAYGGVVGFSAGAALLLGARFGNALRAGWAAARRGSAKAARIARFQTAGHLAAAAAGFVLLAAPPFSGFLGPESTLAGIGLVLALTTYATISSAAASLILAGARGGLVAVLRLHPDASEDESTTTETYRIEYVDAAMRDAPTLNVLRAERDMRVLARLVELMFALARTAIARSERETLEAAEIAAAQQEAAADRMREELSRFLIECARRDGRVAQDGRTGRLLRIVGELEDMTDDCNALIRMIRKAESKNIDLGDSRRQLLAPYLLLIGDFLVFIRVHLGRQGTEESYGRAAELETTINGFRDTLTKNARRRLEEGGRVRTELLFMEIVRRAERLGDHAFAVAAELRALASKGTGD